MSRTHRASISAMFAYLQFGLAIVVGIGLVPYVLHQVGPRLYGYWLASGEVLAYAAMADFGVMGVVPWLIAEADGRKDRAAIRRLMSTGFMASLVVSALYCVLVLVLWRIAPSVLKLAPADRAMIAGPLTIIACVTALVMPLRIASSALMGLQDVKFYGSITTAMWALDLVITVSLLYNGYGLYALALGAAIPSAAGVLASAARLRVIAPDLFEQWPRPHVGEVARLFREGFGAWMGAWGWRLSAATDAIVLASLGQPIWITRLAMTAKLGQMLTQMSWVPGDSSLVGLAQLSGEQQPARVRAAVAALFRVYLTLATAGTCVILAVNGAFVRGWLGADVFGGAGLNAVLAVLIIVGTVTHGLSVMASVLGRRMHVGMVTLASGLVQVGLAFVLGRRFGIIGIPLASLCAQLFLLIPLLAPALASQCGLTWRGFLGEVVRPWTLRSLPLLALCAVAGPPLFGAPMWIAIPLGGVTALVYLWFARSLILDYPPVASLIRARLAAFRLDGLVPLTPAERPPL